MLCDAVCGVVSKKPMHLASFSLHVHKARNADASVQNQRCLTSGSQKVVAGGTKSWSVPLSSHRNYLSVQQVLSSRSWHNLSLSNVGIKTNPFHHHRILRPLQTNLRQLTSPTPQPTHVQPWCLRRVLGQSPSLVPFFAAHLRRRQNNR